MFSPECSELPLTVQPEWEQSVPTLVCRGQRASPLYDDVSLQRVSCPSPTQTLKLLCWPEGRQGMRWFEPGLGHIYGGLS